MIKNNGTVRLEDAPAAEWGEIPYEWVTVMPV